MISFARIRGYALRLTGCLAVVAIVCGICFALRTAVVDYDPITVSMTAQFPREQNLKIYYTSDPAGDFTAGGIQECHVNRMIQDGPVTCQLNGIPALSYIKIGFAAGSEITSVSRLSVTGGGRTELLGDPGKFRLENTTYESVASDGSLKFSSSKLEPSVAYAQDLQISAPGRVWFFPVNIYTCSFLALLIFTGFWWLLSVIAVINKDIESALIRDGGSNA